MRDETKARHIKVFRDERDNKIAVDCDEVVLVRQVCKVKDARIVGHMWELTLRSGETLCIDYDVVIDDLLIVLDMV